MKKAIISGNGAGETVKRGGMKEKANEESVAKAAYAA